jgi:hypothetical protein
LAELIEAAFREKRHVIVEAGTGTGKTLSIRPIAETILGTVHVDYCNKCHGIFLDRGELEQLIGAESSFLGKEKRA